MKSILRNPPPLSGIDSSQGELLEQPPCHRTLVNYLNELEVGYEQVEEFAHIKYEMLYDVTLTQ